MKNIIHNDDIVRWLKSKNVIGFIGNNGRHILYIEYQASGKENKYNSMVYELVAHMIKNGKIEYIYGKI